jgi:hypothetical protein
MPRARKESGDGWLAAHELCKVSRRSPLLARCQRPRSGRPGRPRRRPGTRHQADGRDGLPVPAIHDTRSRDHADSQPDGDPHGHQESPLKTEDDPNAPIAPMRETLPNNPATRNLAPPSIVLIIRGYCMTHVTSRKTLRFGRIRLLGNLEKVLEAISCNQTKFKSELAVPSARRSLSARVPMCTKVGRDV